ncbi:MAG: NUDIX domain-containing protein [Chitinophagales bacterium]
MSNDIQLTADIIVEFENGDILLVKRKYEPFIGVWGLPGGKMDGDEKIEETAVREVKEETGLDVELLSIVGVYSDPERDPRGRYVSTAFVAKPKGGKLVAASDASKVMRIADYSKLDLAFDHKEILEDYKKMKNRVQSN